MSKTSETSCDLSFKAELQKIREKIGNEEWVTIYFERHGENYSSECVYCALIPNSRVRGVLQNSSWDLSIGSGLPGFVFRFKNGKEVATYHRFSYEGVEPFAIWRSFCEIKEGYWEISEEFRHYFKLYDDRRKGKLFLIADNGDENEVVIIEKDNIRVKMKLIKEFLAVKKMHLAIFFDFVLYSTKTLAEQNMKEYRTEVSEDNYCFSIGASDCCGFGDGLSSMGWLMGKKLLKGLDNFQPKLRGKDNRKYEEFIIDIDSNGDPVRFTCDEDNLSNFFGKNEGAPNYFTPVFFKKEVLAKYYSQPNKYSVVDGAVMCGSLWTLRIDNNHPEHVMAFLGDLGHLAYNEQLYWKHFNIEKKGKMSYTAWARGFEAKFADPEKSDLFFKQRYQTIKEKWTKKFGWNLFLELSDDDQYHWKTLRIPLTNEQKEFDEQVLSLIKLIVDSLNEKELSEGLSLRPDSKGITKLEGFLKSKGLKIPQLIKYLRNLQDLRSAGVAHLKGNDYANLKQAFGIGEKDLSEVFDRILIEGIWMLNTLERNLLKD